MVRWSGMMHIKGELQGSKETLNRVNFQKRNSLFYDSQITYNDIGITYALRSGNIALVLRECKVMFFQFDARGQHISSSNAYLVPNADQVVVDPAHALYLKSATAIYKILLSKSFASFDVDVQTIACRPCIISARGGMLAYLGTDGNDEKLYLKKYCPDGNNTSNAVFRLNIKSHYFNHYAGAIKQWLTFNKPLQVNNIILCVSNMAIAGPGIVVISKFEVQGIYSYVLYYYSLMDDESVELIDSIEIKLSSETIAKHDLKRRCTIFEQRGMPACLILNPLDPLSYALFVLKNNRFMTMIDWGKDQSFLMKLKGEYSMCMPRVEYDHLTNKILVCVTRHLNEKNKHAVFARVRFIF